MLRRITLIKLKSILWEAWHPPSIYLETETETTSGRACIPLMVVHFQTPYRPSIIVDTSLWEETFYDYTMNNLSVQVPQSATGYHQSWYQQWYFTEVCTGWYVYKLLKWFFFHWLGNVKVGDLGLTAGISCTYNWTSIQIAYELASRLQSKECHQKQQQF